MSKFKWIVSDLDGTLLHHKDKKNIIYDEVINELHRVIEQDNRKFSIATGRHYKDILSIIKKFKIKMPKNSIVIGTNGCQIYSIDSKKLILNKILDDEIIQTEMPKIMWFLDEVAPNATLIFAYGQDENIYFVKNKSNQFDKMFNAVLKHEDNNGVFKYTIVDSVKDLKNITKFCIDFLNDIDNPLNLIDLLSRVSSKVDYANTGSKFIEIIIKNTNKATALEYINKKYYKFEKEDILVFGDSGNDVEMMDFAGTSVTRHDARPEIQSRATLIYDGGASKFVKNALVDLIK